MRRPPTLDRIILGVVAGAAAGSLILTVVFGLFEGEPLYGWFLTAFLAFLFLLLYLPAVLAPLWWAARLLRLPDWLGAPAAGAAALFVLPIVFNLVVWRDWSGLAGAAVDTSGPAWLDHALLPAVGAVIGLVAWCAARWDVDASTQ